MVQSILTVINAFADARIRAQERAVRSRQRAFWSPTVSLRGNLTAVKRAGAA